MTEPTSIRSSDVRFWLITSAVFMVFFYLVHSILLPFVLGMATAYFLDPAADRLQKAGLSRTTSTLVITAAFFSVIILVLTIAVPVIATQVSELVDTIPGYLAQVDQNLIPYMERRFSMLSPSMMQEIKNAVMNSSGVVARTVVEFFGNALTSGMAFINILSLVLITPVVAFYLLRDWDKVVSHVSALIPRSHAAAVHEQLALINSTLDGFVRGQLNVCILLATYYAIGLSLVGLNFGFIIGLATGFLVIFPYVGLLVGMLTGLTVAFFQFEDISSIVAVLAVFITGQVIEGNFVTPKLVGDKVGLHPVWIIFAMLSGAALFGFVGVLLAVPIAAVLGVLIRFALLHYQQSQYFQ